jgi:hypothetical protein
MSFQTVTIQGSSPVYSNPGAELPVTFKTWLISKGFPSSLAETTFTVRALIEGNCVALAHFPGLRPFFVPVRVLSANVVDWISWLKGESKESEVQRLDVDDETERRLWINNTFGKPIGWAAQEIRKVIEESDEILAEWFMDGNMEGFESVDAKEFSGYSSDGSPSELNVLAFTQLMNRFLMACHYMPSCIKMSKAEFRKKAVKQVMHYGLYIATHYTGY